MKDSEAEADLRPPAIFVMGPTAAGKTDVAIELSKQLPCDLISVDSALVYRGLDIGSAKPDAATLAAYPHRLVDIRDPAQPYSAADFREDALAAMAEISAKGRIPLLVGGTMLYFKVLLEGLGTMPKADPAVRADIEADAERHGWAYVHAQLAEVDPESAKRIHPNDPQRLQRALEVQRISGLSLTDWHAQAQATEFPYRVCQIAVLPRERGLLHERIALRFRMMVEQGLLDEVRGLHQREDLHADLPAMRAVGYRQVWDYLDGKLDHEEMVERGIIATRQLAKRQLTWLRSWKDLHHIYTDRCGERGADNQFGNKSIKEIVKEALKILEKGTI